MAKPLFFILGLIAGLALAAVFYLQASDKYNAALDRRNNSISTLKEAQTLWPPYLIDSRFQDDLKRLEDTKTSGPKVTVYLSEDTSQQDAESLLNQLEIMDGVEDVQFNTLERPFEYINNMTTLPQSKDDIRDHIVVITNGRNSTDEVVEFSKLQEVVDAVTTSN